MSAAHDGGPAYPSERWSEDGAPVYEPGISARDYFAAKAMQGLLAADIEFTMNGTMVATLAMQQADAMLKARK